MYRYDSGVVLSLWMARTQPGQPPPNIDLQLEIDWSGAKSPVNKNYTALDAAVGLYTS